MADIAPSFADRAKQLLADFQHAMENNAPVTSVMMSELKAVLDVGLKAHEASVALHDSAATAEEKAAHLQAEAGELVATIHGAQ